MMSPAHSGLVYLNSGPWPHIHTHAYMYTHTPHRSDKMGGNSFCLLDPGIWVFSDLSNMN